MLEHDDRIFFEVVTFNEPHALVCRFEKYPSHVGVEETSGSSVWIMNWVIGKPMMKSVSKAPPLNGSLEGR